MKRALVIVLVVIVLAVLGIAGTAAAAGLALIPVRVESSGGDAVQVAPVEAYAVAPEGSALFVDDVNGFSLSYPQGFEVVRHSEQAVSFVGPVPQAGTPAMLLVNVRDAGGRSAAEEADWRYNDVRFLITEGMDVRRSTLTLGGIDAVQIDGLPGGQDMNRQVLVVRDGVLFELMFVPMDPAYPDVVAQVEALYSAVVESFTFLPAQ